MLCSVHCACSTALPHYACTCSVCCPCLRLPCPYLRALRHCACTCSVRHACCFSVVVITDGNTLTTPHAPPSLSLLCPNLTFSLLTRLTHAGRGTPLLSSLLCICVRVCSFFEPVVYRISGLIFFFNKKGFPVSFGRFGGNWSPPSSRVAFSI